MALVPIEKQGCDPPEPGRKQVIDNQNVTQKA